MRYILTLLLLGMLAACSNPPSPQASEAQPSGSQSAPGTSEIAAPSESRIPLPTLSPLASLEPDATPDVVANGMTVARAAFEEVGLVFSGTASQFGAPANEALIQGSNTDESIVVTLLRWPDTEQRLQSRSLFLAASVAAAEREDMRALFAERLAALTSDEVGEFYASAEVGETGASQNISDGENEYFLSIIEGEDGSLELVFTDLSIIEPVPSATP